MTTFQQRAITATIFAAVMLVGLFWNDWSFNILFVVIGIGCWWEFLKLVFLNEKNFNLRMSLYILVTLIFSIAWLAYQKEILESDTKLISQILLVLFSILPFSVGIICLIIELFLKSDKPFTNVGLGILSLFYPLFLFFLVFLLKNHISQNAVIGTLFLTWANDTFAYLIGSRIGKTPLLPRISPKKTWEGTIGGAVMCILTGIGISFFFKELPLRDWAVVGGIVAIFGTLGDLVESMLKRSVGVKDSGSFMPGHGGFLDRFDAFIFAIPFVFVYLSFIK